MTTATKLITIILIAFLFSCNRKPNQMFELPPPQVAIATVQASSATFYDEYPTTLTALNQVELRPQVNGYITGLHFKEGSRVKKGEKLYSIDQQQYEAAYQQAMANVAVQEANLTKAQKDVDRYRELSKRDAVAKQQVDNAEAVYQAALKQVDAARASVRSVQTNVRYTSIYAPFDGTIGISQVKLGAAVSAGQTVLNTISSDDPIAADFVVDQKDIARFTQLANRTKVKNDSTFSLVLGGQKYTSTGTLYTIDRAVNTQTGSLTVRVLFSNQAQALRVGMTGTLRVLNQAPAGSVIIPYKAVTEQLGEYFVYKVRLDSSKVTQQLVNIGKQLGRQVIIKSGLQVGETIVVEGVHNLREGAKVALPNATPENQKTTH